MNKKEQLLRAIPKVDQCLSWVMTEQVVEDAPLIVIKNSVREVLAEIRNGLLTGRELDSRLEPAEVKSRIIERIKLKQRPKFRRVVNATGVIIHTNLGRAVLPASTMEMLHAAGSRYSNLEFSLETGKRGSRYSLVEELLCELTGAEAGLVVNNNAAAVLIVLETLAKQKEVVVSRGQMVEIGGSFRIPDVMLRSGARLVEVGATNRTHLKDYEEAITDETALLLKVHCSNYRIIGFTKEVSLTELVALGRERGVPVMEDLGSGSLVDLSRFGLMKEPTVQETISAGVDVVTFSGDKLLGGPQAGVILGRKKYIDKIKKNPINRAVRIDKFTLAGLESILRLYLDEKKAVRHIPTLAMISAPVEETTERAERLVRELADDITETCDLSISDVFSRIGGGAMPEQNVPSKAVILRPKKMSINRLEKLFRRLDIPVIGRVENDQMILDMRTVMEDELTLLADGIRSVFCQSAR